MNIGQPLKAFVLFYFLQVTIAFGQTLQEDSLALVNLYTSAGGANWTNKTNWLSGRVNTWYGVTVTSGRVTSVSLINNNLTGRILANFNISSLRNLVLRNNALEELDITNLPALETLHAYSNKISLFKSNATTPNYYSDLKNVQLHYNSFLGIDISNMPSLVTFTVAYNPSMVEVKTNPVIGYYHQINSFSTGFTSVESLDLRGMRNLEWITVQGCKLSSIDLTGFLNLRILRIYDNQLASLNISDLQSIQVLQAYNNKITSFITNPLPNYYGSLITVQLENNLITSLNISSFPNAELVYAYQNKITQFITSTTPDYYGKLYDLRLHGNDFAAVDISSMPALKICYLHGSGNSNVRSAVYSANENFVQLITNPASNYYYQIDNLQAGYSALSTIDVKGMRSLRTLNVSYSKLEILDISQNAALAIVYAFQNRIAHFITSEQRDFYSNLYDLRLQGNSFSHINITNMPALKLCYLYGAATSNVRTGTYTVNNNFTHLTTNSTFDYYYQMDNFQTGYSALPEINLRGMTSLKTLSVIHSQLATLDISYNPSIEVVYAYQNRIINFITNKQPDYYEKLVDLRLQGNDFSSIDLRNMPALKTVYLFASGNSNVRAGSYVTNENFTQLLTNTSPNYYTQIETVNLGYSALSEVDFKGMGHLKTLSIRNSKFSALNIQANPNITSLYLLHARLTFEDLEPITSRTFSIYQYSPQANINLYYDPNTFTFSVRVGGASNQYQWRRKGVVIPGATSPHLTISPSSHHENAQYQCVITNTLVPGLTLYSVIKRPQDTFIDLSTAYYISKTSGNWSDNTTWQIFDGTGYTDAQAGEIPNENNPVYLQANHTITLNTGSSCKDLHLNAAGDVMRLNTGENTLDVYGKIRTYTGAVPGTNSTSAGVPNWITTGTNGRIRLKGATNRVITEKDEFSDHENLKGWTLECSLEEGVMGTINSNFRAGNVIITSGNLEVKSKNFKVSR